MNIFPLHRETADKKHWVVRWLRYMGFFEVFLAMIAGMYYSFSLLGPMIATVMELDVNTCTAVTTVVGGFLSFVIGIGLSLPLWALSMMIDDLHAMRQYMKGFAVLDDNQEG